MSAHQEQQQQQQQQQGSPAVVSAVKSQTQQSQQQQEEGGSLPTTPVVVLQTPQQQHEVSVTTSIVVSQTQPQIQQQRPTAVPPVEPQPQQQQQQQGGAAILSEEQHNKVVSLLDLGEVEVVDPAIYGMIAMWPCPKGYQYLDIYQGVHPRQRATTQPHKFYPLCKVYESHSVSQQAKVIWQIDSCHIYQELMSLQYLQSLTEMVPKQMWLQNTYLPPQPVAEAFISPDTGIFQYSSGAGEGGSGGTGGSSSSAVEEHCPSSVIDLCQSDDHESGKVIPLPCTTDSAGGKGNLVNGNNPDDAVINKPPNVKPPPHKIDSSAGGIDNIDDGLEDSSGDGGAIVLPVRRKEYEKAMYDTLKILYTEAFKLPYMEVQVGGRVVQLDCFHYVDSSNTCQPEYNNKRAKKFELIARGEQVFIYRWEIKACLLATLRMV